MTTMKRLKNIVWIMLLVPVLVTGCIKDDMDDCHNVTIYFQYLADGDKDVLYQYMDKVDLYVFDESGHILGVGTYNQDQLSSFSAVPSFKLTPGKRYKVVAVGNAYDHTKVVNLESETDFDHIYIQDVNWGIDPVTTNHDDNYSGVPRHGDALQLARGCGHRDYRFAGSRYARRTAHQCAH